MLSVGNDASNTMKGYNMDYAKGYITKLARVERKARKLRSQLDLCRAQWDNHKACLEAYPTAWKQYCNDNGLAHNYTFEDTLC